jgi:chaperonin cofactor prefoldin
MKKIGIWLDKEKAHLVTLQNEDVRFNTIYSEIDFFNPKGGSRSKTRWGPQDVVQDSKYLEREKHQLKSYFKELAKTMEDAEAIAIFGPADTNAKFFKELNENYKTLALKVRTVEKADSMTENQVKALVREFFNKKGNAWE